METTKQQLQVIMRNTRIRHKLDNVYEDIRNNDLGLVRNDLKLLTNALNIVNDYVNNELE